MLQNERMNDGIGYKERISTKQEHAHSKQESETHSTIIQRQSTISHVVGVCGFRFCSNKQHDHNISSLSLSLHTMI